MVQPIETWIVSHFTCSSCSSPSQHLDLIFVSAQTQFQHSIGWGTVLWLLTPVYCYCIVIIFVFSSHVLKCFCVSETFVQLHLLTSGFILCLNWTQCQHSFVPCKVFLSMFCVLKLMRHICRIHPRPWIELESSSRSSRWSRIFTAELFSDRALVTTSGVLLTQSWVFLGEGSITLVTETFR